MSDRFTFNLVHQDVPVEGLADEQVTVESFSVALGVEHGEEHIENVYYILQFRLRFSEAFRATLSDTFPRVQPILDSSLKYQREVSSWDLGDESADVRAIARELYIDASATWMSEQAKMLALIDGVRPDDTEDYVVFAQISHDPGKPEYCGVDLSRNVHVRLGHVSGLDSEEEISERLVMPEHQRAYVLAAIKKLVMGDVTQAPSEG